jgi:integrase/recombinase XerD
MARKGERKPFAGDPNDPEGLIVWVRRYIEHLAVRNYSAETVTVGREHFRGFVEWCFDRGIHRPIEITKSILEAYQRWLFY